MNKTTKEEYACKVIKNTDPEIVEIVSFYCFFWVLMKFCVV